MSGPARHRRALHQLERNPMLVNMLNKLQWVLLLLSLVFFTIVAIVFSWKLGGAGFLVVFIVLNGPGLIWDLVWHPHQSNVDERVDQSIRDDAGKGSKDNPTIR